MHCAVCTRERLGALRQNAHVIKVVYAILRRSLRIKLQHESWNLSNHCVRVPTLRLSGSFKRVTIFEKETQKMWHHHGKGKSSSKTVHCCQRERIVKFKIFLIIPSRPHWHYNEIHKLGSSLTENRTLTYTFANRQLRQATVFQILGKKQNNKTAPRCVPTHLLPSLTVYYAGN